MTDAELCISGAEVLGLPHVPYTYAKIVTATVKGTDLDEAPQRLSGALEPYPDARVVTVVQESNWVTSMRGETSLLAVIEYNPAAADE